MTRKPSRASVGTRLKRARERCGLSLRQIADSTKISVSVLEGLERDDITYLPGGVLGRGYIRSFAGAVNLDPEITVAKFVEQFPESSVKNGYPPSERIEEEKTEARTSASLVKIRLHASGTGVRVASVAGVAVVLAGVVAFGAPQGWQPWSALQSLAESRHTSTRRKLASLEGRPIPMLRPSKSPTLPSALSRPVRASARTLAKPDAAAGSSGVISPDASTRFAKPLKVTLSASSPSWVIATVDGKQTINRFFEIGNEETLEARRELVVTAGNGESIVMTLNGKVTRSLGQTGKTATVRVDHSNIDNYLKRGR